MKVLVIGSGGREHALVWALAKSPQVQEVIAAPGNAGIAPIARCVDRAAADVEGLLELAIAEEVDLVVVGPEGPLTMGIADRLAAEGIPVFGPSAAAAELEGSKIFTKELCREWGIPTGSAEIFEVPAEARAYIEAQPADQPLVVKADGLAAGKGVIVAANRAEALKAVEEIMEDRAFGAAGDRILVEEFLQGEEVSILALVDGGTVVPLVEAQDHKRAFDGDQGPNTGGMGTYSPVPSVSREVIAQAVQEILEPAARAMVAKDRPFRGCLFAGLMITEKGPRLIEFNARFGDPETQVVLARLQSDLFEALYATATGRLDTLDVRFDEGAAVCVVMASGGYPGSYEKGAAIEGLAEAEALDDVVVFHAGTAAKDGQVVTAGGRVLGVVGKGDTLEEARERAYSGVEAIRFRGCQYRGDIGP